MKMQVFVMSSGLRCRVFLSTAISGHLDTRTKTAAQTDSRTGFSLVGGPASQDAKKAKEVLPSGLSLLRFLSLWFSQSRH